MTARGDARKRQATPSEAGTLTEAEREELLSAMCAPDPDRAPVTEVQMLYLTSTVARIKAEAVQAERERLAEWLTSDEAVEVVARELRAEERNASMSDFDWGDWGDAGEAEQGAYRYIARGQLAALAEAQQEASDD